MVCSTDLKLELAALHIVEDWDVSINRFFLDSSYTLYSINSRNVSVRYINSLVILTFHKAPAVCCCHK